MALNCPVESLTRSKCSSQFSSRMRDGCRCAGRERDGEVKGGEWSKVMEGVMCCRGKSRGRIGACDREKEEKGEIDRKKDSRERVRETAWQLSPKGVGSFLWASIWFFSFLPNPRPPPLYFSESRPMCFPWALALGIWLPATLFPPSFCLCHSSLHIFLRASDACGPYSPYSLLAYVSSLSHPP